MEIKTPLYEVHVVAGAKMVPFGGFLMPVQYEKGIIAEHMAVRKQAGLFDVCHMGELMLKGKDALANLQRLLTNDFANMQVGQCRYSPMCNPQGGVIDDLLVYKTDDEAYMLVVNASNRHKDADWIQAQLQGEVEFLDASDQTALVALQGPASQDILQPLVEVGVLPEKYYTFTQEMQVAGVPCLISKTGYTGEDGYELYCAAGDVVNLWEKLIAAGSSSGLIACGLGARDTLRLEAGMPLYGHEMDDEISPLETGLGFFVKMQKADFIGKQAIEAMGKPTRRRVGLKLIDRGIAREKCLVLSEDWQAKQDAGLEGKGQIGITTSGTHCPYLGYAVAMALVEEAFAEVGTEVWIDVRGRKLKATVVKLPFYKKSN